MQKPFEFNGIKVKTPDKFAPSLATTSTEDSDRTQDLVMHNTPMGTVEAYEFQWDNIEPDEAAKIINQVKNKAKYRLRYMNPLTGSWSENDFYSANYSLGTLKSANGGYAWESLSFQATGVNPV